MIDEVLLQAEERMKKAISALEDTFATVRTGRANAMILDHIKVDYYGAPTPINQMAAIKSPDAHMLIVEPWDKSSLGLIEQALQQSDIGVSPNNDGTIIRLPFPSLTEERRLELVKQCKAHTEDARVALRNARRDANSSIEKLQKDSDISEDDAKRAEAEIQKLTDTYVATVDTVFSKKEAELMEI